MMRVFFAIIFIFGSLLSNISFSTEIFSKEEISNLRQQSPGQGLTFQAIFFTENKATFYTENEAGWKRQLKSTYDRLYLEDVLSELKEFLLQERAQNKNLPNFIENDQPLKIKIIVKRHSDDENGGIFKEIEVKKPISINYSNSENVKLM